MRNYLLLIICFTMLSCATKEEASPKENPKSTEQNQTSSPEGAQMSQIVFRDAQGNVLTEAQKDSLLEKTSGIQALRRINDNNTEYILFKEFDDLRGFIPDDTVDNLIQEYNLMQSGGRGAVITQRIIFYYATNSIILMDQLIETLCINLLRCHLVILLSIKMVLLEKF